MRYPGPIHWGMDRARKRNLLTNGPSTSSTSSVGSEVNNPDPNTFVCLH